MTQPIHERVAAVRQRATEASTVEELRACITELCDAINETLPKMTDYFGEPREWLEMQANAGVPGASFRAGMAALKDRT